MNAGIHLLIFVSVVIHGLQYQESFDEMVAGYFLCVLLWESVRRFFCWLFGPITISGSVSVTKR